jgi:hypothetical protein
MSLTSTGMRATDGNGTKEALQGINPDSSTSVALTTAKQTSILHSCSEVKRGSGAKRA